MGLAGGLAALLLVATTTATPARGQAAPATPAGPVSIFGQATFPEAAPIR